MIWNGRDWPLTIILFAKSFIFSKNHTRTVVNPTHKTLVVIDIQEGSSGSSCGIGKNIRKIKNVTRAGTVGSADC